MPRPPPNPPPPPPRSVVFAPPLFSFSPPSLPPAQTGQARGQGPPPADIQATRRAYGLDRPLGEQYIRYWKGVLHGDLGPSFRYNQSVTRLVAQRYPYTLKLTLASLFVAVILSIPAGIRSAQPRSR